MRPSVIKIMQFGLDRNQALQIISLFKTEVNLKKNGFWLQETNICQNLGFIAEGMCRHYCYNDNGDEITRWVSLGNEFITSLGSFIRKTKNVENIQAIIATKFLVVRKKEWEVFYKKTNLLEYFGRELSKNI